MLKRVDRKAVRRKVRYRIRKQITGTAERPRLSIYRSLKNIYAQAVDDSTGKTLAAASTQDSSVGAKSGNREGAAAVGKAIAERLQEAGVKTVVFDRGGFVYHGRVKALADAARSAGLKF